MTTLSMVDDVGSIDGIS